MAGYKVRLIHPQDYEKIFELFNNHFVKTIPILQLLGWSPELEDDMTSVLKLLLPHNLSYLAETKEGEVIGACVSYAHTPESEKTLTQLEKKSSQFTLYLKAMSDSRKLAKLEENLGTNCYVNMLGAAVNPKWDRLGVAKDMFKAAMDHSRKRGHDHIAVECSSPFMRDVMDHIGFYPLGTLDLTEVKGFEGKNVFEDHNLDHEHYIAVYAKLLRRRLSSFM